MIARAKRITLKSKTTSGSNKKAKQKTRKGKTTKNQKKRKQNPTWNHIHLEEPIVAQPVVPCNATKASGKRTERLVLILEHWKSG